MYMQVTQKSQQEPATPLFELGWPSQAVSMGRTVKGSANTLASEKVAGKNQYAVNMGTMDQFTPAPVTRPVAQIGPS
jgi:hypothetical protein